jgi:ATP-binding cassette subfamily B protein
MAGDEEVELTDFTIEMRGVRFAYNEGGGEGGGSDGGGKGGSEDDGGEGGEGEGGEGAGSGGKGGGKGGGGDVIKDLSVVIPQGSVTALVGPSGSGKTTVSRLIARFWDVRDGEIRIGGRNVRDIDPERLMNYMSFVFQDVVLFDDTVMNNIRVGRQGATDEEVHAAARMARCDGFVREMPQGYETLIGENGSTLSGGERQRISIARALLKDAPIVLLDEATASLDPENETQIQEALSELVKGRTVIVIAHRLRTVIGADKIVVLDEGRLVEEGRSEQLLAGNGLFARMYAIQKESSGWRV